MIIIMPKSTDTPLIIRDQIIQRCIVKLSLKFRRSLSKQSAYIIYLWIKENEPEILKEVLLEFDGKTKAP